MDEQDNIISLEAFSPQQQEAPAPVEPRQKRKYTKRKKGPRKARVSKASAPTTANPVPPGVVTFEGQGPAVSLSLETAGPKPLDRFTRYIATVFRSNHAPLPAIVREPDGALLIEPDYTHRYAALGVLAAAILAAGWWLAWNWW